MGGTLVIKSQNAFVVYGTQGWLGSLNTLDNSQTYMIQVSQPLDLLIDGIPLDALAQPLTLSLGWNWIAFPHDTPMSVAAALGDFTPSDGDVIKGQQGFSTYNASENRWVGSLNTLVPGKGYMYYKN